MEIRTILDEVRDSGLKIALRNDQIMVNPISGLGSELRTIVQDNRGGISLAIKNAPSRLVRLAIVAGIHEQGYEYISIDIRRLQDNQDLQDAINCSDAELRAWASALAIRATQRRGRVPQGWDMTAICKHCGPVYSFHTLDILSCGWCELRLAGKWF